jgi:macrolide-specific efflux system membrane fusion protein
VGQTLNANQTTPTILRIADLSVMTVEADVSEADVLRVEKGQEAYFTTLGGGGQWTTNVRQVLPQPEVLNDVVLYKVLLDVENKDEKLKPEMTAQVFCVQGKAENAIIAPVAALREGQRRRGDEGERRRNRDDNKTGFMAARASDVSDEDGLRQQIRAEMQKILEARPDAERKMALVMIDGAPQPRPVLVGLQNRTQAEILFGLEPGDVVVTGEAVMAPPVARNGDRSNRPPAMGRRGPR